MKTLENRKSKKPRTEELLDGLEENPRALLFPLSEDKERGVRRIAEIGNLDYLKKVFSKEKLREKYEECLYELFMLFANPKFAESEYSKAVLSWLAEQGIEEIILGETSVSMVHWLAASNNLEGVRWAFDWYYAGRKAEISRVIFGSHDKYKQDIFDYVVDGILDVIESSNYPQTAVIAVVLEEFAKTIEDPLEKEWFISEKKKFMKSSLLKITDLTCELEEQLLTSS